MVQATRTELEVRRRDVLGKKVKQLRRQGLTPANIYGHHVESLAIQVPTDDLRHVLRSVARNEIVYLRLDGDEPRPSFIRLVQRDAITDAILHVDFYQVSLLEKVRMNVPLHLVGTAPAVDMFNGTLLHGLDAVAVEGLPTDIPMHIDIDVSGLEQIDQSIHVSDLALPANLTLLTDPELVVAKVAPPAVERAEEVEEAVEGEVAPAVEGEEAAAPAAGGEES